jgi:sensor histidine kinase YesM
LLALALGQLLLYAAERSASSAYFAYNDGLSVADWAADSLEVLLEHTAIALPMLWLIGAVAQRGPQRGPRRALALAVAVVVASALGMLLRVAEMVDALPPPTFALLMGLMLRYALIAALLTAVGEIYRREVLSLQVMRAAEADRDALDRETLQARLQTLQAQIEPHFLFNTLANVRRLYELDGVRGRRMLDHLMRYLEVALPSMRDERSTLAREAALIDAYLQVQQVRMGRRLGFAIHIEPELAGMEVPPMMLLTLAENAVKHGLAPLPEGGRIDVAAVRDGARLRLEVVDDGRGFGGDSAGSGTGLANIRARLAALHGDAARLDLAANAPRGVRATITLPIGGRTP